MSKTVSFVAREELAEWLESEAEDRMKTMSSLVQEIVADEYRRQKGEDTDKPGDTGGLPSELQRPPFSEHERAWYIPNTQEPDHVVAVRIPESAFPNEDRRYYKTFSGAAKALRRWYE